MHVFQLQLQRFYIFYNYTPHQRLLKYRSIWRLSKHDGARTLPLELQPHPWIFNPAYVQSLEFYNQWSQYTSLYLHCLAWLFRCCWLRWLLRNTNICRLIYLFDNLLTVDVFRSLHILPYVDITHHHFLFWAQHNTKVLLKRLMNGK